MGVNNQFGTKQTALVIGGSAPNSPLIAGALATFLDPGIEFDVIFASGAGVRMGLLHQASKDYTPAQAWVRWAQMAVADTIYKLFPVNCKVFLKPGTETMQYRSAMLEGDALDALNFQPFESTADGQSLHDDVDTLVGNPAVQARTQHRPGHRAAPAAHAHGGSDARHCGPALARSAGVVCIQYVTAIRSRLPRRAGFLLGARSPLPRHIFRRRPGVSTC